MDHFPPKLAEGLALLESDDLPALGAIHGQFEGWIKELKANKSVLLGEAEQGLQIITDVMLSDSQNPDADIEALRNKAQSWQKGKSALGSKNDEKSSDEKPLAQDPASFAADSIGMKTFMDHAGDVNQEIENLALEMEKEGPKEDLLEQVLRHLHNIKGEAGLLQLKDLGEVCHELESACRAPLPERMSDILLIFSD